MGETFVDAFDESAYWAAAYAELGEWFNQPRQMSWDFHDNRYDFDFEGGWGMQSF